METSLLLRQRNIIRFNASRITKCLLSNYDGNFNSQVYFHKHISLWWVFYIQYCFFYWIASHHRSYGCLLKKMNSLCKQARIATLLTTNYLRYSMHSLCIIPAGFIQTSACIQGLFKLSTCYIIYLFFPVLFASISAQIRRQNICVFYVCLIVWLLGN